MKTSRFLLPASMLLLAVVFTFVFRQRLVQAPVTKVPAPSENSRQVTAPSAVPAGPAAAVPVAVAPSPSPVFTPAAGPPGAGRVPTAADAVAVNGRPPAALSLAPDFLEKVIDASGQHASFPLPDGRAAAGTVEWVKRDAQGVLLVQGRLTQPEPGFYFFQRQTVPGVAGAMVGNVRFDKSSVAFRVDPTGAGGAPRLVAVPLEKVVCVNLQPPPVELAAAPENAPQTAPINIPIPAYQNGVVPLQSLPGAPGVIYLDFDGETGPFSGWGSYDAAPSGANNDQIKDVWQRVCEDYQAFNLNITTDRRAFDNAAQGQRQHVLITPTTTAAPGSGGVAYLRSFNNTGDTVCWAFYSVGKDSAEVIAHEVGHTLGLSHDGRISPAESYYGGQGSGEVGWAPIMGVGYYQNLVQFSKGEYVSANNTEDDLAIITSNNNSVAYRADDYGATLATAGYLEILADESVANEGIIETRTDVDAFRFTTAGGAVSLAVSTVNVGPDLDILAEIYDATNVLVASANPDTGLSATVATTLAAGEYTLRVSGVGRGSPTVDGYSDYDSLGAYLISGSVAGGTKPDRFTVAENSANGTAVGAVVSRNSHGANPLTFAIASGNTGTAFAIDPSTGAVTVASSAQLNFEALSLRWDDPATFQLFVSITDATNPALNETVRVVVTVSDVNEAPTVTGGAATIVEHASTGAFVFKVTGNDVDRYEFPVFSIIAGNTGGAFAIDAVSGQITVAADTAVAVQPVYALTVQAADHGTPALTTTATVTITVAWQPITLASPTVASVNIPAGVGLTLVSNNAGRSGTAIAWSKVSGPGTVTFDNAATLATGAKFSASGNYVLRCAETSGAYATSVDVSVNAGVAGFVLTGTKVGTQAIAPSHTVAAGVYNISAAGAGIPNTGTPDDFYFLNLPATGNVTVTARVVSVAGSTNARAGVMIRESLAADAREAFCGVTAAAINGRYSGRFIYRATTAAASAYATATVSPQTYWVRLIRTGNSFAAQIAPDSSGTPGTFVALGTAQTIAMSSNAYVGLAATSGAASTAGTAVIDNLTITPMPVNIGANVSAGLAASLTLPNSISLDGTVSDDGKPLTPGVIVTTWSKVSGPGTVTFGDASAVDTSASVSAVGAYVLRLTTDDSQVKTFADVGITAQLAPMEQWRQQKFGVNFSDSAIAGDLADPDFDSLNNLLEYALALDPLAPGTSGLVADLETIGADRFLRLSVTKNTAATDLVFSIEVTGDLKTPASWTTLGTTVESNTSTQLRVRDNTPVSSAAPRDIRLKVAHP